MYTIADVIDLDSYPAGGNGGDGGDDGIGGGPRRFEWQATARVAGSTSLIPLC